MTLKIVMTMIIKNLINRRNNRIFIELYTLRALKIDPFFLDLTKHTTQLK
jgi:hypothetical protein